MIILNCVYANGQPTLLKTRTASSHSQTTVIAEKFSSVTYLHSIFIDEKFNEMYVGKIEPRGLNEKKIFRLKPDGTTETVAELKCWYITALATDSLKNLYVGAGNNDGKWKLVTITPDSVISVLAENLPEFGKIQITRGGNIEMHADTIYTLESVGHAIKTNRRPICIDRRRKWGYGLDRWSGNHVIKYEIDENDIASKPDTVIYNIPLAHGITIDNEGKVFVLGYQDNRNILAIYDPDSGEKRFVINNDFYCPPSINPQYIITGLLKGKGSFGKDYLYFLVSSEGIYRLNISSLMMENKIQ
jgi:hypothetical protein